MGLKKSFYVSLRFVIPKNSRFSTVMRQLYTLANNQILALGLRRTPYLASSTSAIRGVIHKRRGLSTDISHFSTSYVMQIFNSAQGIPYMWKYVKEKRDSQTAIPLLPRLEPTLALYYVRWTVTFRLYNRSRMANTSRRMASSLSMDCVILSTP